MTLQLCDPAAWAAAAHRLYYLPAATNYAKLITHPRFAAKTGIARTLERWCRERPELASRLKTQPQVWLQAFEEAKSHLMWQAREAMAYVACCVDAPDHHAMQCACDDRGGKDLSFGLQACAAVTEQICLTPEGTALARRMAFCREFLPARHIFYEDRAPPNKDRLGGDPLGVAGAPPGALMVVPDVQPSLRARRPADGALGAARRAAPR